MSDERALLLADLRERAAWFATLTELGLPADAVPAAATAAARATPPAPARTPGAARGGPGPAVRDARRDPRGPR